MTDEEYIYRQDIKERNSQRSGARNRVNGFKNGKCTIPSDHLTRAQQNQLVEGASVGISTKLAHRRMEKYRVGLPILCKYWFHVSAGSVYKYIHS